MGSTVAVGSASYDRRAMVATTPSSADGPLLLPLLAPAVPVLGAGAAVAAGVSTGGAVTTGAALALAATAAVWADLRGRRSRPGTSASAPAVPRVTLADLERLLARERAGALPVRLSVDAASRALPPAAEDAVVAVLSEAIANARRHARGATHVVAAVTRGAGHITVTVADDGAPTPSVAHEGGLARLRAELTRAGGRLAAGPRPSGGWALLAVVPVTPPRQG